jgi:hypothetical protein
VDVRHRLQRLSQAQLAPKIALWSLQGGLWPKEQSSYRHPVYRKPRGYTGLEVSAAPRRPQVASTYVPAALDRDLAGAIQYGRSA